MNACNLALVVIKTIYIIKMG